MSSKLTSPTTTTSISIATPPASSANPAIGELQKNPLADGRVGTAGFASCSINLLKSIMGTGMLSLPYAFAVMGAIPGFLLLVLAVVLSAFGLQLLVLASDRISKTGLAPERQANFSALAGPTYPKAAFLFNLAVVIKCIGVAVSYLTVAGTLMPQLVFGLAGTTQLTGFVSLFGSHLFWVTAMAILIAPVTFMRRMDSLKYTSFLGLIGIAYLFGISVILFFVHNESVVDSFRNIRLFVPFSLKSLQSFPIFAFACNCHQNIFPIYNEIRDNRPRTLLRLISTCLSLVTGIYVLFALAFYGVFGDKITDNVIGNLPKNEWPYIVARFLYAFLMLFSYPLQTFPARSSLLNLLGGFAKGSRRREMSVYTIATTAILLVTWGLASAALPLRLTLALVGCTAGPIICYFLPAMFWWKLESSRSSRYICIALYAVGGLAVVIPLSSIIITQTGLLKY